MQKLLLSVWFWNKNDECPKIHMIWKHCNEAEGHYFICSRGSSLIWCLWYVHFQTLMDLTSIHLAAWAGVPLFSWSLSYYTLLNLLSHSLLYSGSLLPGTSHRCVTVVAFKRKHQVLLRYCLLPRLLILCGSFCLPFFSAFLMHLQIHQLRFPSCTRPAVEL